MLIPKCVLRLKRPFFASLCGRGRIPAIIAAAALTLGMVTQSGVRAQSGDDIHMPSFGDSRLLSACFSPSALKGQRGEIKPVKGVRTFDATTAARTLAAHSPIPAGLSGAIRRVNVRNGAKLIALTLDLCEQTGEIAGYDGPIIDYLRENRIKATLFTGGKWMRSHELRIQQLMADPLFEIGNHGEAHRNLRLLSPRALGAEIEGPQRAYEAAREGFAKEQCVGNVPGGLSTVPPRMGLFRFPFGACNAQSLNAVNAAGLLAIQWDISTGDPDPNTSAKAIVNTVMRKVKPGSIIIGHANGRGHHTAAALSQLIPKLRAQGYKFVTVSELLAAGTPEIVPTCYDSRPGDTDRYDRLPFQKRATTATARPAAGAGAADR
ncbi:Polysaccharide deacetylase [Candidatus Filomicrobium marinum]|uniref:Chitooligosaccharide deacetylase n=2 Tax=Candidatus Filomicrobium marinum TaxID=1608628 RepID=A0A0D6JIV6_9HYPH|nr:Polysaccharide deacetylase [Candidatus Filomicrobium marinum]CPR21497.1 Polysaccharide deacetylase [Candidatus Filomicrobium marinum]